MSAAHSALESVSDSDRQKIYDLVEHIDTQVLSRFNAWKDITSRAPGATLLHIDAEDGGVYFDPGKSEFVILAEVSIGNPDRVFETTVSASIRARRSKDSVIEVSSVDILPLEK